jgi:metal-responsive CopG/Arc/MetJ family transcriptional regulator
MIMSAFQRVTITLPTEVLAQARELSQGNLSQFVANVLSEYFNGERRRQLREELIAGYIANAEEALATAEEFHYAEDEADVRYSPPHVEIEEVQPTVKA